MRLADECRDERDREQHDEPRRVDEQARGEAGDGDQVLRLAEKLAHEPGAAGRLRARPLEPILELAILEILEVEARRVLHQPHAGRGAQFFGKQ